MERFYPIGTPGAPWSGDERESWRACQVVHRSYQVDVVDRLRAFGDAVDLVRYGALPVDPDRFPLYAVRIVVDPSAPWALVTGGVHGYETSGVFGALAVIEQAVKRPRTDVNLLVVPCVSPWGYEVINRWNPGAVDPNRSFRADGASDEAAALMRLIEDHEGDFILHIDLHETTDSDESEFRPAAAARDGLPFELGTIPDGFYTVGDSANPQPDFQAAIVSAVSAVTHIAPADDAGQIIGADVTQPGVINYPFADLGLCAGITSARFTTTTEVYPDSPEVTPEICVAAQLAAVDAGLQFVADASAIGDTAD